MSNTITTGTILNEVQSEIPELTETKQVYRAINRVIRDINGEYPGIETMEEVLKDDSETPTVKDDVADDYSWNNDDHILTLSPYTREIQGIFFYDSDGAHELTKHNVQMIKDYESDNALYSSKYMYARYDRDSILFPSTLLSSATENDDPILIIKYLKDIIPLSKVDSVDSDTAITLPLSMEQVLINGVFYYLFGLPQYVNKDSFSINKEAYFAGLAKAKASEIKNMQSETKDTTYKY